MKRILCSLALAFGAFSANAQLTPDDIIYYIGSGPDTAYCVIDFQDGSADSSYAWGYLFDASVTTTGGDMLSAIAADDPGFDIDMGAFLNDITYNSHAGIGSSPDFWGTWSRTASTAWAMNSGIDEELANQDWYGCSYTDFAPAIEPGEQYAAYDSKKWSADDVQYWIGTGADSAVLVVDFVGGAFDPQQVYSWGYLFDGTTDGATMLTDIATADVNVSVDAGTFLNDIYFNTLAGIAATPYHWGTWSGTNLSDWTLNAGLSTTVNPGDWFGCSYEAWEPRRPFYPVAALDSAEFIKSDVTEWYGTGADSAVIVIDFNESQLGESYAFGYLFDGTATGEDALNTIAAEEPSFTVDIGGFLNDITYLSLEGIGGTPNFWGTWSATNAGGWYENTGITTTLSNGDWFGCSYTDFSPNRPPSIPEAAISTVSIDEEEISFSIYPNPTIDNLYLNAASIIETVEVFGLTGELVLSAQPNKAQTILNVEALAKGSYIIVVKTENATLQNRFVKQ
ncbi:MAG: T9SS type A sorting domain-containing protein [Crocinitomicaceae bacterium]|nr:T9SS type A sorting domain-containing protein [Crocinitomicaceae bacterium]